MPLIVGTSGWQYADWRGTYYPAGLPQGRWLEHVLADFTTVEVNASFYRLPTREVTAGWHDRSPADAVFAMKASRYLTHVRRLREPAEPVARLLDRIAPLRDKLGPVLLQLPPDLRADLPALAATLRRFPAEVRLAVEPRHPSWFTGELAALLAGHDAALVWSDRQGRLLAPLWRTASWGYLRLHEGRTAVWPFYGRRALAGWVRRLATLVAPEADCYVYFNNDPGGAAVYNAVTFARAAAQRGLPVTRVPRRHPAVARRP